MPDILQDFRHVAAALATTALAVALCVPTADTAAADEWVEPTTNMRFVAIPAGRFVMGTPATEAGREQQERQHEVIITRAFHLGRFEVTQEQWAQVMSHNPSWFKGGGSGFPVERVSGLEVHEFLHRLNSRSQDSRFRLPTEAEWEYACRAGTALPFSTGRTLTTQQANFAPVPEAADQGRTIKVGSFAPNAWGLHDMHGNVWEWTGDEHCPYAGGVSQNPRPSCGNRLRVIRGGSWYFGADSARCGLRYTHDPKDRGFSLGFRVVREKIATGPPGAHPS